MNREVFPHRWLFLAILLVPQACNDRTEMVQESQRVPYRGVIPEDFINEATREGYQDAAAVTGAKLLALDSKLALTVDSPDSSCDSFASLYGSAPSIHSLFLAGEDASLSLQATDSCDQILKKAGVSTKQMLSSLIGMTQAIRGVNTLTSCATTEIEPVEDNDRFAVRMAVRPDAAYGASLTESNRLLEGLVAGGQADDQLVILGERDLKSKNDHSLRHWLGISAVVKGDIILSSRSEVSYTEDGKFTKRTSLVANMSNRWVEETTDRMRGETLVTRVKVHSQWQEGGQTEVVIRPELADGAVFKLMFADDGSCSLSK